MMIYIEKKLNNSWAIFLVRILATGPYFEVLGPPSAQMDHETGKAALQEAYFKYCISMGGIVN